MGIDEGTLDRAASCPGISYQVGILRSKLDSSLATVVRLDPEPERALDGALGLAAATTEATEAKSGSGCRGGFGVASRVRESWRDTFKNIVFTAVGRFLAG